MSIAVLVGAIVIGGAVAGIAAERTGPGTPVMDTPPRAVHLEVALP